MREIWAVKAFEVNGEKKTDWKKIGVAFVNNDGSERLKFNLFPTDPNNMEILIRDKKERQQQPT